MKKLYYTILATAAALTTASCVDLLNTAPENQIASENMWTTPELALKGMNGLYETFYNRKQSNGTQVRSENLDGLNKYGIEALGFCTDYYANNYPIYLLYNQAKRANDWQLAHEWKFCYTIVHACNDAITNLHKAGLDAQTYERYLCEARFLRAWAYSRLNKFWQGVPVYLEPISNEQCTRTQESAEYVWREVVLPDLKYCIDNASFPDNTLGESNFGRPSKGAAYALRGMAYMWLKEYSLADQTIEKMKNDASFMALETDISTWKKMFAEELNNKASDNTPENDEYSTKEFIFIVHFNMDEVGTNGYSYMYQWFTGSGNRAAVMSPALLAKYDQEKDLRFPLVTKNYQSGWEMRKYISGDISSTLNRTCEVGYPIYRYSDMILLQAEAQARQSKWEEALDLVKPIRTRAGLETPSAADFADEEELVDFILDERQRELVGEGRRWFDLVRTGRWKSVMGPINGCQEDGNELFPIHFSHLDQNKKLVQNSYYATSK